jgi:hypothetical protein
MDYLVAGLIALLVVLVAYFGMRCHGAAPVDCKKQCPCAPCPPGGDAATHKDVYQLAMSGAGEGNALIGTFWSWWQVVLGVGGMSQAAIEAEQVSAAVKQYTLDSGKVPTTGDVTAYVRVLATDVTALNNLILSGKISTKANSIITGSSSNSFDYSQYSSMFGDFAWRLNGIAATLSSYQ